jgi:hypothetical protein
MDPAWWRRNIRDARIKLRNDGAVELLSRGPAVLAGTGYNLLLDRAADDDDFLGPEAVREFGSDITEVFEDRTVTVESPVNTESNPFPEGSGERWFDAGFVCTLPDVRIVGPDAIKFDREGRILCEDNPHVMGRERFHTAIYRYVREQGPTAPLPVVAEVGAETLGIKPSERHESAFPMVGFPTSFHHWVIEFLPRIRQLERYESRADDRPTVLVPPDPPSYVTESLALLGYPDSEYREWTGGRAHVDQYVYPSPLRDGAVPNPAACEWLRDRMTGAVTDRETDTMPDRLFVSREDARMRRIVNRSEIEPLLQQRGFEPVRLSDYPVADQVALFAQADCVVGAHGAGLTNILYGTELDVVELFPSGDLRGHYHALANVMDHDYHFLTGHPDDNGIQIDPAALGSVLDEWCLR